MDDPLAHNTSFVNGSRIYILQNALNQQPWRNAELTCRLLEYLKDHLAHEFQNVREKISFCLTSIFCKDVVFPNGNVTNCPRVCDFFAHVMPKLNALYQHLVDVGQKQNNSNHCVDSTSNRLNMIKLDNGNDKSESIRLFKTGETI